MWPSRAISLESSGVTIILIIIVDGRHKKKESHRSFAVFQNDGWCTSPPLPLFFTLFTAIQLIILYLR